MLNIYPTANVNFQRQNSLRFQRTNADKPKKSHKEVKLALTLAGLAAIAAGAVWLKKNKAEPFEKALERSGVELKNNVPYFKGTDTKFTGSVKRNSMSLGMEKEVVNIVDGRITEELYYNSRGEELYCRLYKNGKLYRSARIHYSRGDRTKHNVIYYEYDEKSNELIPPVIRTGRIPNEGSFFEQMRGDIPKGREGDIMYD